MTLIPYISEVRYLVEPNNNNATPNGNAYSHADPNAAFLRGGCGVPIVGNPEIMY